MKPELKKGHRWLRAGEVIRKGDWYWAVDQWWPVMYSIGDRVHDFAGISSRPIKKRKATK